MMDKRYSQNDIVRIARENCPGLADLPTVTQSDGRTTTLVLFSDGMMICSACGWFSLGELD